VAGPLPLGMPWPQDSILVPQSEESSSLHAYVHIPFCEVRCGYCDFNTYTGSELPGATRESFHKSLIREIEFSSKVLAQSAIPKRAFSSVFFGGGTPSLFEVGQIQAILVALEREHGIAKGAEVTLEANPETLSREYLQGLFDAGVNRLSMGAQSFDEDVLSTLERKHDPAKVIEFVAVAKEIGFRTSIDLIFGAPGESMESWANTLQVATSLQTEHISCYSLIVEDGTKLAKQISRGELAEVDEDLNAEKYELATKVFSNVGLEWYEVSNWGVPSTHNLAYWRSQDWWGYGPGAHSHISGNRFWNRKHPSAYATALEVGSPAQGMEVLDSRTRLEERLLLEMRIKGGVPRSLLNELLVSPKKISERIGSGDLVLLPGDRVGLSEKGRLVADGIVLEFLSD
jgi:putative oxygen-independent coproporphyrinogen III oxidase